MRGWEGKEENEKNEDQDGCRMNQKGRVTGQDEQNQEQNGCRMNQRWRVIGLDE